MAGMTIRGVVRSAVCGTRAFAPLRSIYQHLFDRERLAFRRKMRGFYSKFVGRGDLVFDIGANVGVYSEVFSELGAAVVAVEPNPRCYRHLVRLASFPGRRMCVVDCAVGDQPGWASMHVCEDSAGSTLNHEWRQSATRSTLHRDTSWLGELKVPTVTLDQLESIYGTPHFVKIDVEGYEDNVLKGMTFRPEALSFEFNRLLPEVAICCLDMPVFAEGYEFNLTRGMEMQLASKGWVGREELKSQLETLAGNDEYADILVRRST